MSLDSRAQVAYFRRQAGSDGDTDFAISFPEMMNLHDELFVEAAFRAVLGREVDANGLQYYVGRLRKGFSRISVVDQLVRSPEARTNWSKLSGLEPEIGRYRRAMGLKGWRLALRDPELGRLPAHRRTRMIQNSLGAQRQLLEEALQRVEAGAHQHPAVTQLPSLLASSGTHRHAGELQLGALSPRSINDVRRIDLPDHIVHFVDQLPL